MKKTLSTITSPFTGGKVYIVEDIEKHKFRKEIYEVHVRYYICEDTGEKFTDNAQDELLINELYNQHRLKHGIPFPDEIKKIRLNYGLNYTQITKIAGFGQNQWKNYENGDVPSESNAKIIIALSDTDSVLRLLGASRNEFTEAEYDKVKKVVQCSNPISVSRKTWLFFGNNKRDCYNGYSELNPIKMEGMVRFFVSKETKGMYKTKLNKCLFYADMLNYRRYGHSISGARYRAIQHGPVPEHYDTIYDNVEDVYKQIEISNDKEYETLHTDNNNTNVLSCEELNILQEVSAKLQSKTTYEVVELSHLEEAWQKHKDNHELIPYSEAFSLRAFE